MVADEVTRRVLATYEGGNMITMCGAWCRQVAFNGDWFLAPRAALSAIDSLNTLSHSICPACVASDRFPS